MLHHKFDEIGQDGETVGDIAFRRIRTDIIHGRLQPGQKLRLEVLKERYGVSVSTLREILSKLTVEEFVTAEGQRGFEVTHVSQAGLRDVAALRLLLETYALRKSFAEGDLNWEGALVSAYHKLAQVEKNLIGGDQSKVVHWVEQDWGFHHATISACNAPALMTTHSSIFDRFLRYHMLVLDFRGKPAAEEHAQLRDLALARNADKAVEVLTSHVQSGVEHILGTNKIPV